MHELSIALSILEVTEEEAERRGGVQVVAIHVRLGPLAGVVKEALLSAYDLARAGSPLAGAQLIIEDAPVAGYCPTCQAQRAVVSVQNLGCAECGTLIPQLASGRNLEVTALEIQ